MLDADEIIEPADYEKLALLLQDHNHDAWALPRVNWQSNARDRSISFPDRQLRLFRNGRNIHYEGVVHERLVGYRQLGWPPPIISFLGQVGGPHIHHLSGIHLTQQEMAAKTQ